MLMHMHRYRNNHQKRAKRPRLKQHDGIQDAPAPGLLLWFSFSFSWCGSCCCFCCFGSKDNVTMLNSNQSGNTNHSLVILHATLNACGESGVDFGRQLFQFFASTPLFSLFFWFFIQHGVLFVLHNVSPSKTVSLKFFQRRAEKGALGSGQIKRNVYKICCSDAAALEIWVSGCLHKIRKPHHQEMAEGWAVAALRKNSSASRIKYTFIWNLCFYRENLYVTLNEWPAFVNSFNIICLKRVCKARFLCEG